MFKRLTGLSPKHISAPAAGPSGRHERKLWRMFSRVPVKDIGTYFRSARTGTDDINSKKAVIKNNLDHVISKAFSGFLILITILGVLLFIPAWTIHYLKAWLYLLTFAVSTIWITLYLFKNDPKLLEKRVHTGAADEIGRCCVSPH